MEPKQGRAKKTYEALLAAAQEILAEAGLEKLNSNSIVARAGYTPPVFYRYFEDKFDLLKVLANRLMDVQNEAPIEFRIEATLDHQGIVEVITKAFHHNIRVTKDFTAGYELMVLMRMMPELREIRLASHAMAAGLVEEPLIELNAPMTEAERKTRCRLVIELFYSTLEMLFETDFDNEDEVIRRCAVAASSAIMHPDD